MSPTKKKILASAATIAALAIALPLLFIPSTACACITVPMMVGPGGQIVISIRLPSGSRAMLS